MLGARKYTVTRTAAGSPSGGHYVAGATSTFSVKGSMQPMDSDRLELLPEWARTEAAWILLCDKRQSTLAVGDRVARDGHSFLVHEVMDWSDHTPLPYRSYALGEVTSG